MREYSSLSEYTQQLGTRAGYREALARMIPVKRDPLTHRTLIRRHWPFGPATNVGEKINECKEYSSTTFAELTRQMARIRHRAIRCINNQRQRLHVCPAGNRFCLPLKISTVCLPHHQHFFQNAQADR